MSRGGPALHVGTLPLPGDVDAASRGLRKAVARTPLVQCAALSARAGARVYLKLETLQPTGSFKVRGACHAVLRLAERGVDAVVTASAGNHGAGVAYAAGLAGVQAHVFVPAAAPAAKRERIQGLGARLVLVEGNYDAAEAEARAHAAATGLPFVHAFEDLDVVAGQSTVCTEILEQLPDVAQIVVPVGGGGLAAGVGAALAAARSRAELIGVQTEVARAMFDAFANGAPIPYCDAPTLADGLAGGVSEVSFDRARTALAQLVIVSESDVAAAMRVLVLEAGVAAEGSAAVGVAALLAGAVAVRDPCVLVVTGANVDAATIGTILQAS